MTTRTKGLPHWIPMPPRGHGSLDSVVGRARFYICIKHGWDALGSPCPECAAGDAPRHCSKHGWSHANNGCPECTAGRHIQGGRMSDKQRYPLADARAGQKPTPSASSASSAVQPAVEAPR